GAQRIVGDVERGIRGRPGRTLGGHLRRCFAPPRARDDERNGEQSGNIRCHAVMKRHVQCPTAVPSPAATFAKKKCPARAEHFERRGPESNRRIGVLQTPALPLGYRAEAHPSYSRMRTFSTG